MPLAVGIAAGLLAGGTLSNWSHVELRWWWIVAAAFVVREAVALSSLNTIDWLRFVYVGFLLVLVGWGVSNTRRLPGLWLVAVGAGLNLMVILANDFRMPVSTSSGALVARGHVGQYVLMDSGTKLRWLGDWITVPGWFGGVYSPGDVVVGLGIGVVAFLVTRRPRPRIKLDETSGRIGSYPP
jgi:hypothetical protein